MIGLLRLLLACVALGSIPAVAAMNFPSALMAIRCLFAVSGLLTARVLLRPDAPSAGEFYRSRARRIFPVYWLLLALALLWWYWLAGNGADTPTMRLWQTAPLGLGSAAAIWASQISLLGLDWMPKPLAPYLIMPYAWPLATELSFLLLAPWLLRLPRLGLALLAAGSLLARGLGVMDLPLADLGFFCLGALALPLLGKLPKGSKIDRCLGQLSLSLYLAYPLVTGALAPFIDGAYLWLSLAFALLVWWWIVLPIRQAEGAR